MAARFCMSCGGPLPPNAAFCSGCGSAVAAAPAAPAAPGPAAPPPPMAAAPTPPPGTPLPSAAPPPPPPVAGPSLGDLLGLSGQKSFLVQHQILSLGHSYRVMDPAKRHLFTVKGDAGQNLTGNLVGGMFGGSDSYLGRMAARGVNMTYSLVNAQEAVVGQIHKEGGANQSTFTLLDNSGRPQVRVVLDRGLMGGITATAVDPNGQPMLRSSGNLLRHNFMIEGPGGAQAAKVHEAWVAVRDTYNIDILGGIDPMFPLVFAILIDFEKVK